MIQSAGSKLASMDNAPDASDADEAQIVRSWNTNAKPWTKAIQTGSIRSRRLVTDQAIVDAVLNLTPRRVLDLGCGEGWLARALCASGIEVTGVDAVGELIAEARRLGGGEFHLQPYEAISSGRWRSEPFDAAVCNFSLLGKESVDSLIGAVGGYLCGAGHLIVQTLHPVAACGENRYQDGWRPGNWSGFSSDFRDPAPWYFRTLQSWISLLRTNGFELIECREPTVPDGAVPSSVIFVGKRCGAEQTNVLDRRSCR
jgi:2-polyprenyl-3-methyl-5-hydroxy-6-metoxy-1,4-benzoquinol methylase